MNTKSLARLLQLVSPTLPVGGYAYSQGLEYAIDSEWVIDEDSYYKWVGSAIEQSLCFTELPLLMRLYQALASKRHTDIKYWSEFTLACRETKERFSEDQWLADAYKKVTSALSIDSELGYALPENGSYLLYFAAAAVAWEISERDLLEAYVWQFIEGQTVSAMKLIPLGQTAGMKTAHLLANNIGQWVDTAQSVTDDEIGATQPGWVFASMLHETQYSRLYRS